MVTAERLSSIVVSMVPWLFQAGLSFDLCPVNLLSLEGQKLIKLLLMIKLLFSCKGYTIVAINIIVLPT